MITEHLLRDKKSARVCIIIIIIIISKCSFPGFKEILIVSAHSKQKISTQFQKDKMTKKNKDM